MCKYRHTTLLEYEGKKHVAPGETWADETVGATKYWYTQRCHCRPLETRDTSLPLLTFNISLLFITVDLLFKKYCLRSTVIPQARKKTRIYKHVRMYTSLSTFCILKIWSIGGYRWAAFRSTTVSCLDILWKCYFLILWYNFICCFEHCFPVMFLQPNCVINSKYSCPS